jgi:hypothetical protein
MSADTSKQTQDYFPDEKGSVSDQLADDQFEAGYGDTDVYVLVYPLTIEMILTNMSTAQGRSQSTQKRSRRLTSLPSG